MTQLPNTNTCVIARKISSYSGDHPFASFSAKEKYRLANLSGRSSSHVVIYCDAYQGDEGYSRVIRA
jgi:hypothetical protein